MGIHESIFVAGDCGIDEEFTTIKVNRIHVNIGGNDIGFIIEGLECPKSARLNCIKEQCPLAAPYGVW